jgi:hypothetical protein
MALLRYQTLFDTQELDDQGASPIQVILDPEWHQ